MRVEDDPAYICRYSLSKPLEPRLRFPLVVNTKLLLISIVRIYSTAGRTRYSHTWLTYTCVTHVTHIHALLMRVARVTRVWNQCDSHWAATSTKQPNFSFTWWTIVTLPAISQLNWLHSLKNDWANKDNITLKIVSSLLQNSIYYPAWPGCLFFHESQKQKGSQVMTWGGNGNKGDHVLSPYSSQPGCPWANHYKPSDTGYGIITCWWTEHVE